jgi:hypothetical protein
MHVFDGLTRVLCVLLCGSTRKYQDATQVRPARAIAYLRLRLSRSTCEPVLSDCAMSSTCAPVPYAELMPDRDPDLLISRSEAEDRVVLTRDRYAWCSVSLVALLCCRCCSVLCPAYNLACRHAVVCWNQETLGPKRRQGAVLHSLPRHGPPVYNRTWWCKGSRRKGVSCTMATPELAPCVFLRFDRHCRLWSTSRSCAPPATSCLGVPSAMGRATCS